MSGNVTFTKEGAIATVVIENEGRLNALSLPMWRHLRAAFEELGHDRDGVRCIVLRGAGDAFASGADIAEFENERYDVPTARAYGKAIHPALIAISECPHPVISMIHGPCVGGGLEIAGRTDIRICDESARFGIGQPPGSGLPMRNSRHCSISSGRLAMECCSRGGYTARPTRYA